MDRVWVTLVILFLGICAVDQANAESSNNQTLVRHEFFMQPGCKGLPDYIVYVNTSLAPPRPVNAPFFPARAANRSTNCSQVLGMRTGASRRSTRVTDPVRADAMKAFKNSSFATIYHYRRRYALNGTACNATTPLRRALAIRTMATCLSLHEPLWWNRSLPKLLGNSSEEDDDPPVNSSQSMRVDANYSDQSGLLSFSFYPANRNCLKGDESFWIATLHEGQEDSVTLTTSATDRNATTTADGCVHFGNATFRFDFYNASKSAGANASNSTSNKLITATSTARDHGWLAVVNACIALVLAWLVVVV